MNASIRLFKAVLVKDSTIKADKASVDFTLKETVPHGFVLAPEVVANYDTAGLKNVIKASKAEIGLSGSQANATFHKSWQKVATASKCQLLVEQLLHYLTTYGFDQLGIYSKDSVYIPREELSVPGIEEDVPLVVIKGLTRGEMMAKLMTVLASGIALKEDTIKDIVDVAIFIGINEEEVAKVKNKEARVMLYDHLDLIPSDPVEFLRLAVYKSTGTTLLIKNKTLVDSIKASNNLQVVKLFNKYDQVHGLVKLSAIFNRFKPIFLAFRTNQALKYVMNVTSKLSKDHHVPMPEDYLNQVTSKMARGIGIDFEELRLHLAKVNVFRKARLAYALKFRSEDPESILYKVRNGSAYSMAFSFPYLEAAENALDVVLESIAGGMKGLEGKRVFIPENIVYALPTTEKQFTGDIPSGSYVEVEKDMIIGVHWQNVEDNRVDLDLKMSNIQDSIGWDGSYRNKEATILFSGDITDAPGDGATESFYVKKQSAGAYTVSLNNYTYFYHGGDAQEVPFTFFVAREHLEDLPKNYTVNQNNIVCKVKAKAGKVQKVLGLVSLKGGVSRFHFSETDIGNSITMRGNKEYAGHALRYMISASTNPVSLNDVLAKAGAILVSNKDEKSTCDFDLSPESVSKDTFLTLLQPEEANDGGCHRKETQAV